MPRRPPLPVLIEDQLEARLRTQTASNGYAWPVREVQRRKLRDQRSRPGGTVELGVDPEGFEQDDDLNDSLGVKSQRAALWNADYWLDISEDDNRPLSTLLAEALADLEDCLSQSVAPHHDLSGPFNGLAYNARLLQPSYLLTDTGEAAGVRARVQVQYRYSPASPDIALPG